MPVYFARHIERDLMKIGCSAFPCDRVCNLRIEPREPAPLRLVGFLEGGRDLERAMHRVHQAHRAAVGKYREYFVASDIANAVEALCSTEAAVAFMREWCARDLAAVSLSIKAFGGVEAWAKALRWDTPSAIFRADLEWCHAVDANKRKLPPDWRDSSQWRGAVQ